MSPGKSPPTVLLVDAEPQSIQSLSHTVSSLGYQFEVARSGEEALAQLDREEFDLILLDLYMPDMDGLKLLAKAQKLAPDTICIILTAYGTLDSAVSALRRGAYDYLLKPCPTDDLADTLQRGLDKRRKLQQQQQLVELLREALTDVCTGGGTQTASEMGVSFESSPRLLSLGPVTLDTQWRAAVVDGELVRLSRTEYNMMRYFAKHLNRAISCRELVQHTHGQVMEERNARSIVRMHIYRLRRKLEPDPSAPRYLLSVRGVGYMFSTEPAA